MRRVALVALLAAITPCSSAQRPAWSSPHFTPTFGQNFGAFSRHHSFSRSSVFLSDPFYSDALYSIGYPVASQPPVIILQAPPPANSTPAQPAMPTQPLLIELRGDRYVRVSGEETSGTEMINQTPAAPRRTARPPDVATQVADRELAARELAPVVLVFRDGHREEVSDYTIADGVLYTRGDYYTDGSWNRKIELNSLDLPETVKSNQLRNVRFQLPTSPNEVIVRP